MVCWSSRLSADGGFACQRDIDLSETFILAALVALKVTKPMLSTREQLFANVTDSARGCTQLYSLSIPAHTSLVMFGQSDQLQTVQGVLQAWVQALRWQTQSMAFIRASLWTRQLTLSLPGTSSPP